VTEEEAAKSMHKSRSEVEEKVSKIERSLLEMQKVIREVTEQQG
jgi:hypothetical protein